METSSPTKEVQKVVSAESKPQDEVKNEKNAPAVSVSDTNVDEAKVEDAPVESVQDVQMSDKTAETCDSAKEKSAVAAEAPAAETSQGNNDEGKDSVETENETTASAHSEISKDEAVPVQSNDAPESEIAQQKPDEHMETEAPVQTTTEVDSDAPKDVAMDESQNVLESASQQPTEDTAEVVTISDSVSECPPSADAEVIDITQTSPGDQEPVRATTSGQVGSLSLLAEQYDSGNDSDVCEVPSMQNYQNRVVEIDSDTESSSSSSEEEEDNEPIDVELINAVHADDDEEENVRNSRSPKVKGEFALDDLPPIHELQITVPEEECTELGKIQSIVEQLVIVNSLPGTVPLDLDTVLFLDKGKKVLGEVFDVLGQVSDPMYCIRFNSNKDIKAKGIEVGQTVYVAPRTQHTQFVILANLMKEKGSDASWEYDVEPPERYLDYSDDEEERNARRTARNKNRPMEGTDEAPKRYRPGDAPSPSGPRPYRGNYHDGMRMPNYPNNYRFAGNSWHSNFPQNYNQQPPQYPQYRQPPRYFRPPHGMPVHPPAQHPGMVVNPYAVYPPPHLMQQPLFPPPTHQPPPPPPPGPHGGY